MIPCSCGHTAHWHSHDGAGACEHDGECCCARFTPSAQVHLSISLEQARAVERLARRAGERDGSPMLSELSLLASVAIVEAEGRAIREAATVCWNCGGRTVRRGRQTCSVCDGTGRLPEPMCPQCADTGRVGAWTCGCPAGVALDRARRARVEEMDRAEQYGDDSDAEARDAWAMRGTGRA
jgi:hypothetical protein